MLCLASTGEDHGDADAMHGIGIGIVYFPSFFILILIMCMPSRRIMPECSKMVFGGQPTIQDVCEMSLSIVGYVG